MALLLENIGFVELPHHRACGMFGHLQGANVKYRYAALLVAVAALVSASATAQISNSAAPEISPAELNARFLFSAFQARRSVRELGAAERTLAENFWTLATEFSEIVRRAEPQQQILYTPLLEAFRTSLQQRVVGGDSPDVEAMSRIRALLHEQVEIARSLGANPGSRASVTVTVRALINGQPRSGFYVWLDSPADVPTQGSAQSVPGTTNNATMRVTRATYLIRIIGGNGEVGRREHLIGHGPGDTESVDVVIRARAQ